MFKKIEFKQADPTRRTPTYLQAYTKENLIWQLKLTVVYIAGMELYRWFERRQRESNLASLHYRFPEQTTLQEVD